MKKTALLTVITCFLFAGAKAQLTNTKFKGTVQMESPTDIVWSFEKDTSRVYTKTDSMMIETMLYKLDKDVLSLTKAYGTSPCDMTVVGKYKIELKDDKMTLTLIEDACNDRANAINGTSYTKIK